MKIQKFIATGLIAVSFLTSFYFYPELPQKMATHWGISGEVNGYMDKVWGAFFLPVLSLIVYVFLRYTPRSDPKLKNSRIFQVRFEGYLAVLSLFLLYIHLLTTGWNLGYRFNLFQMLVPAFSFLFWQTGDLIGKIGRNYFIGIRTPWTVENDLVWNKTHALAASGYKILALTGLIGIFRPELFLMVTILPLIVFSLFLAGFSYFIYRKSV
jgi:uncharacterized membrane protein